MSKIGKVVKIQHFTYDGRFKRSSRPTYAKVEQEYVGGDVRVENSTDVWAVRPSKDSKASFETYPFTPDE